MPKRRFSAKKRSAKARRPSGKRTKRSYKKRSYKTKRKGLPRTKVRTSGTFRTPALQSRHAARHVHLQLEQKFECPVNIPGSQTSAGYIYCFYFNNNNISPTAWSSGGSGASGQACYGLGLGVGTYRLSEGAPNGINTLLYTRFTTALVLASELGITIRRTGIVETQSDGFWQFALTPMTNSELIQTTTGGHTIDWTGANNVWVGGTPAAQWSTCLTMPGTVVKRIGTLNGGNDQCHLHMKHHQNYFNTEPLWQGYGSYQCLVNAPTTGYLPAGYGNYYVLTAYQSSGDALATVGAEFSFTVDQKYFVKGWQPYAASQVSLDAKVHEDQAGLVAAERLSAYQALESKEEKRAPADVDTEVDEDYDEVISGLGRTRVGPPLSAPKAPAAPAKSAAKPRPAAAAAAK